MPNARIYFQGERVGPKFSRALGNQAQAVREGTRAAAEDAAKEIEARGSADIAAGGNFGPRWTTGLHATVTEGGGNIRIAITHDVPYFSVFEFGKVIKGNPWLWIPLDFAKDAKGVYARDYPGKLFRVDRLSGAPPLLLAAPTAPGMKAEPKYFGKTAVTIPKKFHIVQIAREVAHEMPSFFKIRKAQYGELA